MKKSKITDVSVVPPKIPMKLKMPILECQIRGCRNLAWKCADCGRSAATALTMYGQWISVDDLAPPSMQTILLCVDGKVIVGWNEAVQPEEEPAYCSWEHWPESFISGEGVTHWMALPKPPKDRSEES